MKLRRKGVFGASKHSIYFTTLFFISVFIGVGYAYLNSSLNIIGSSSIKKNTWNVYFDNIRVKEGSVLNGTYSIENQSTLLTFTVSLDNPGDFYEFEIDVKNGGSIDAMLADVVNSGISSVQAKYLEYTVSYSDNSQIRNNDLLVAGNKERILVKVKYKDNVAEEDLPGTDQYLELQLSLTYIQADNTAVVVTHPVCKRAKMLHTETCSRTDTQGCKGVVGDIDAITYGSLGTTGTLISGDAFDCDVSGDKDYNASTERFYYMSNLDTNNNYAVLIYYNNVTAGVPDNSEAYVYDSLSSPRVNGPLTATQQLPTTSQWANVELSNATRKIKDEAGTEYMDFDYSGYAARLLTYGEVVSACGAGTPSLQGYLSNCKYLVENTNYSKNSLKYGYWLENVSSSDSTSAIFVNGDYRRVVGYPSSGGSVGVRPVIEVLKTKIDY